MKIEVKTEDCVYITINGIVYYIDDSTGEQLMKKWKEKQMVDSLKQAGVEIRKILYECERDGDNFDVTLNKVSDVKVLGESFSTLMLMKIIDKFAEEYETRNKAQASVHTEEDLRDQYNTSASRWNQNLN